MLVLSKEVSTAFVLYGDKPLRNFRHCRILVLGSTVDRPVASNARGLQFE